MGGGAPSDGESCRLRAVLLATRNFLLGMFVGFLFTWLLRAQLPDKPVAGRAFSAPLPASMGVPLGHDHLKDLTTLPPHLQHLVRAPSTHDSQGIAGDDYHLHNDESSIAYQMYKKVRVLCWVMTQPKNHKTIATTVQNTWGRRCNKLLFVSESGSPDLDLPILEVDVDNGRDHLTAKTMQAFDYISKHYINDYDWFLKADDDTYVIVENLRYLLSEHSPDEPVYFGHHFYDPKWDMTQGYFSGGGGYVLSRAALDRFSMREPKQCTRDGGSEDVEIGYCMEKLGVKTGDSRDSLGRTRFHCFTPDTHINGGFPSWYKTFDKYHATVGAGNMSDYAISFHYVDEKMMHALEFYVYHLRPYGILNGEQNLN